MPLRGTLLLLAALAALPRPFPADALEAPPPPDASPAEIKNLLDFEM